MYNFFVFLLFLMATIKEGVIGDLIEVFISSPTSINRYHNGTLTPVIQQATWSITALTVDGRSRVLFWSDVSLEHRGIYKTNTDGFSPVEMLYKDVSVVSGLTADTMSQLLYWTDEWRRTVEVGGYDGPHRVIIASSGLSLPRPILAVGETGFLYWGDQGTGCIERSRLDGSDRRIIVNDTFWPSSLTWDDSKSVLLWTDGWMNQVNKCDNDGGNKSSFMDLSLSANTSSLFGIEIRESHYLISLMDGRVLSISANETTPPVIESVLVINHAKAAYAITTWSKGKSSVRKYQGTCTVDKKKSCSHLCLPGANLKHQCACPSFGGLSLVNGTACQVPTHVLLYINTNGDIGFLDLNEPTRNQHTLIDKGRQPMGLSYDPVKQMVYYSDLKDNKIYRIGFNGTGKDMFLGPLDGIDLVTDMVVDTQRRNLYFTNYGTVKCNGTEYSWNRIEMVDLQNHKKRFVINADIIRPHALALDNQQRWIYVLERNGTTETIWRMALDGSQRAVIPLKLGVGMSVTSLSIVRNKKGSYLLVATTNQTSNQSSSLLQISLSSSDFKSHETLNLASSKKPIPVASFGDTIYISGTGHDLLLSNDTRSVNVNVVKGGVAIMKMVATKQRLLSTDIRNEENSACADTCGGSCVPLPGSFDHVIDSCICSANQFRVSGHDNLTCEEPEVLLVFADVESVKALPLSKSFKDQLFLPHSLIHHQNPINSNIVGLLFDEGSERFYFTDNQRGAIYSGDKNGEKLEIFFDSRTMLNDTNSPQIIDSLALDRTSSPWRLLWTSSNKGLICAMDTSGENATYLEVLTELDNPRALLVDEESKTIYWSECGANATVRGATLAGERVFTVFKTPFMWPNSLVLHPKTRRLFVADGEGGVIYECGFESEAGEWKCNILKSTSAPSHIFSMVFFDEALYLTSWETKSVDRFGLATRIRVKVVDRLTRPTQLTVVRKRKFPEGCHDNNRSHCGQVGAQGDQKASSNFVMIGAPVVAGVLGFVVVVVALIAIMWKKRTCWHSGLRCPRNSLGDRNDIFSQYSNSEFVLLNSLDSNND